MAVHHPATIVPTKLELLQAWVPHQPWAGSADTSTLTRLGSYRFDDPDGEVGIETHLLAAADGQILQVPLTYRGSPRLSADATLITTMTHTTLGDRWIYDACDDPVYVSALVTAIVTGGREADLFMATEAGLIPQAVTTHVRGNGTRKQAEGPDVQHAVASHDKTVTRISAGIDLTLFRTPNAGTSSDSSDLTLTGTWPGQETPLLLATISTPL